MSFDRLLQPTTKDIGKLFISCCEAKVDGASVGVFKGATFNVDSEVEEIQSGYPTFNIFTFVKSTGAKASLDFEEIGGAAKTLLSSIIGSLHSETVPTKNVTLELFRPRADNVFIDMSQAALLQEFDLNFSNDFNSISLGFEQLVDNDEILSDRIAFSEAGPVTYAEPSPMLNTGNLSLGFPRVTIGGVSVGAVSGVTLKLTTEYKRVMVGYPTSLFKLIPVNRKVTLDVNVEEVGASELNTLLALSGNMSINFIAALYDGTAISITMPISRQIPVGEPGIDQTDWGYVTKRFIATGSPLLTIS